MQAGELTPCLRGQPLCVCCHTLQSGHSHGSWCQTAIQPACWVLGKFPQTRSPILFPAASVTFKNVNQIKSNSPPTSNSTGFLLLLKSTPRSFLWPCLPLQPHPQVLAPPSLYCSRASLSYCAKLVSTSRLCTCASGHNHHV